MGQNTEKKAPLERFFAKIWKKNAKNLQKIGKNREKMQKIGKILQKLL